MDPTSKIAKETFENFCDMWRYLVNDVIQVAKEILESFKSFSLLGGANTSSAPLKPSPSTRTYFNSVFQNRDPFSSVYPSPRHQPQQRLNNVNNSVYNRTPAPILTNNVNGQVPSRGQNNITGGRSNSVYMDRGHPDGMPLNNEVRWQGQEDRRPPGSGGHNYSGGKLENGPHSSLSFINYQTTSQL